MTSMVAWILAFSLSVSLGSPSSPHLIDRVVALVDEDPILQSDLERVLALGFVAPGAEESPDAARRRALDGLIVQRLRFHEVDSQVTLPVADAEIERQVAQVRSQWEASGRPAGSFEAWLAEQGLEPGELRRLLIRQLRVLVYIEERLGPRVFVDLDEITTYYESVLRPRLQAEGAEVPPLPEIREQIRGLLRQEGLDREIERWTEQLRSEADIVDLLDSADELPPVAKVVGPPVGAH